MRSCKLSMHQEFTKTAFLFIVLVLGNFGLACQVFATEISSFSSDKHFADPLDSWPKVSDSELEKQRGGFLLPNGVMLDISIEKVISLNGVEAFSSYFQFPENSSFLRHGDGNIAPDSYSSALASVIQNNLDSQVIKTMNTINLEISNLHNTNVNHDNSVFIDQIMPGMR